MVAAWRRRSEDGAPSNGYSGPEQTTRWVSANGLAEYPKNTPKHPKEYLKVGMVISPTPVTLCVSESHVATKPSSLGFIVFEVQTQPESSGRYRRLRPQLGLRE